MKDSPSLRGGFIFVCQAPFFVGWYAGSLNHRHALEANPVRFMFLTTNNPNRVIDMADYHPPNNMIDSSRLRFNNASDGELPMIVVGDIPIICDSYIYRRFILHPLIPILCGWLGLDNHALVSFSSA